MMHSNLWHSKSMDVLYEHIRNGYMNSYDTHRIIKVQLVCPLRILTFRFSHDGKIYRYEQTEKRVSINHCNMYALWDDIYECWGSISSMCIKYGDHTKITWI